MSDDQLVGPLAAVRARQFGLTSCVAAVLLVILYFVAVRTHFGQEFDDLAFEGRAVEDPEVTRELNELLLSVSRSTLLLLTSALVLFAVLRRRVLLAVAVGLAVTISVVSTEILKTRVLERPELDDIAGLTQNSFPSGHATISMALSLGLMMVMPHRWRWAAMLAGLTLTLTFGVGVLATGWHRPSDVLGAYLVCIVVFAAATALLLRYSGRADVEPSRVGEVETRLTPAWAFVLGSLVVVAGAFVIVYSFTADAISTVDFATWYIVVCLAIMAMGSAVVIGYHELLRGLSLGMTDALSVVRGGCGDRSPG